VRARTLASLGGMQDDRFEPTTNEPANPPTNTLPEGNASTEFPSEPSPEDGAGLMVHRVPFQCSIRGACPIPASPQKAQPTAQTSLPEIVATLLSELRFPAFGLGTTSQSAPSQCSMRWIRRRPQEFDFPPPTHHRLETAVTPMSEPLPGTVTWLHFAIKMHNQGTGVAATEAASNCPDIRRGDDRNA